MKKEQGEIFCSNCASIVDEEADSCKECGSDLEKGVIQVNICPVCGCPRESKDEYNQFKENLLDESISIEELQWIFSVMDNLLEDLPEEKVEEFAQSENFELYKRVLDTFDV